MNGLLPGTSSALLRTLTLAACAAAIAPPVLAADVDLSKPQAKGLTRTPEKIELPPGGRIMEFARWKSTVPPNDVVGQVSSGVFCSDSRPLTYTKNIDEWLHGALTKAFKAEAVRYGFSTPEEAISVFDDKSSNGVDYRVGATMMAFDYRSCGGTSQTGSAYSKFKWEVFSVRRQQVVYSATLESSWATTKEINEKEFDSNVMQGVVDNLLADPAFVAVINSGGVPTAAAVALPLLQLNSGQLVNAGIDKGATKIVSAVVTVESGVGSGTAFYITQDGYLLTNQHVVADDKFVRIKLASGRSIVGEVVRVDKQRDVALLHTDPTADEALGLRIDGGTVGEPVHVVGSPFGQILSGTITKGVLSARRVIEGVAFLQSDVAINPGNSGGPMLDASGRVIGIATLASHAQGINLFVPIDDALDKLSISVKTGPVATAAAAPVAPALPKK